MNNFLDKLIFFRVTYFNLNIPWQVNRILFFSIYLSLSTSIQKSSHAEVSAQVNSFLSKVLPAALVSAGNGKAIYPILQENSSFLNDRFVSVFKHWVKESLNREWQLAIDGKSNSLGLYRTATKNFCAMIVKSPFGIHSDLVEICLAGYEEIAAFDKFILEQSPKERERMLWEKKYAQTQLNMVPFYLERSKGKKEDNIEIAIKYCRSSLKTYIKERFPSNWARSQYALGNAYYSRVKKDRSQNIERSIECYHKALQVFTRGQVLTHYWTSLQYCLSVAYLSRLKGARPYNLRQAFTYAVQALSFVPRAKVPEAWAKVTYQLAKVYEAQGNYSAAVLSFRSVLEIYTSDSFPRFCFDAGVSLGDLGLKTENWKVAIEGYSSALNAVDKNREWTEDEGDRQAVQSDAIKIYENMIQACINANLYDKALETLERRKARNLVELFSSTNVFPKGADEELKSRLVTLKGKISAIRQLLAQSKYNTLRQSVVRIEDLLHSNSPGYEEYLSKQRKQLEECYQQLSDIQVECQKKDSSFFLTQKVTPISCKEIQLSLGTQTAILEWHIASDSFQAFLITKQDLDVVEFNKNSLTSLVNWCEKYQNALFNSVDEWKLSLSRELKVLSGILRLEWLLDHPLLKSCNSLIIIPHRYLNLVPMHALPIPSSSEGTCNTNYVQNRFPFGLSYAPSCQFFQLIQKRNNRKFSRALTVVNPTKDLSYTELSVNSIREKFKHQILLQEEQATKEAFRQHLSGNVHCLHLSCHGYFNSQNPLLSALIFASDFLNQNDFDDVSFLPFLRDLDETESDGVVTLKDLFAYDLRNCQLTTMSACETGIVDFTSLTDEYIGLQSGFLYAGTSAVLSSLWPVRDLATSFLMARFYQHLQPEMPFSVTLSEAQQWLRSVKKMELQNWVEQQSFYQVPSIRSVLNRWLHQIPEDEMPFKDPFYWAAFYMTGQP